MRAYWERGFLGGTSGKEHTWQCRECKRCVSHLSVRRIPWRRAGQPTPVFLPGESHGQRSLEGHGSMGSQRVGHYWSSLALTHTESETGGLGKTHVIEVCEKRARSLHFMLIEKGRQGNFQLRYDLVFIIKKLFWLLWGDVTTEWGGTEVQTVGPVMRLFLVAIQVRDVDSLDQKKKKKKNPINACYSFCACCVHLLQVGSASD